MSELQLAWSFLGFIFLWSVASLFINPVKVNSDVVSVFVIVGKAMFFCFIGFSLLFALIWSLTVVTK